MSALLNAFGNRRIFFVLLLGFSSGIPLALTGTTLQAWMTTEKVDLTVIGIFSLVGLPYTFKFLWSPLMDRFVPPFLGRRRGWMLVTQAALFLAIAAMAFSEPKAHPGALALLSFLVAFCSASQDIVVDAWRTEVLAPEELGPGAGVHILGYRVAMLTSGAIALILADRMPWRVVYLLMAGSLVVGMTASLLAPEPELAAKSAENAEGGGRRAVPGVFLPARRGRDPAVHRLLQARRGDGDRADDPLPPRARVHEDRHRGRDEGIGDGRDDRGDPRGRRHRRADRA